MESATSPDLDTPDVVGLAAGGALYGWPRDRPTDGPWLRIVGQDTYSRIGGRGGFAVCGRSPTSSRSAQRLLASHGRRVRSGFRRLAH